MTQRHRQGILALALLVAFLTPAVSAGPLAIPPLVGIPQQSPQTPEEYAATAHLPDPTWVETQNNLLVVNARTGEILSWQDHKAPYTDIRIEGVDPEGRDFRLTDPSNVQVFLHAWGWVDGTVMFPGVVLTPGTWTVTLGPYGPDEKLVTTFESPSLSGGLGGFLATFVGKFMPAASTAPAKHGYRAPPNCGPYRAAWDHRWYLTPLAILHAPYGGSSTMKHDYTSTKTVYVGPWGTAAQTDTGFQLQTTGGKTTGAFKYARWVLYMHGNSCRD